MFSHAQICRLELCDPTVGIIHVQYTISRILQESSDHLYRFGVALPLERDAVSLIRVRYRVRVDANPRDRPFLTIHAHRERRRGLARRLAQRFVVFVEVLVEFHDDADVRSVDYSVEARGLRLGLLSGFAPEFNDDLGLRDDEPGLRQRFEETELCSSELASAYGIRVACRAMKKTVRHELPERTYVVSTEPTHRGLTTSSIPDNL